MMAVSRDGRFDHAFGAEFREQAFGDFESAAVHADVFADGDDGGVALHFLEHRLANGFEHGDRGHQERLPCLPLGPRPKGMRLAGAAFAVFACEAAPDFAAVFGAGLAPSPEGATG